VVLGGTAIFSAMNGFTPHMAGAIDIMVVEQPDGSLKCSPFYGERRCLVVESAGTC
jgi:phosphatidate phosphatase PAH1